jgi:nicotinamidase-related amidase
MSLIIGQEMQGIINEVLPNPGEDVIDKPGKGSFFATVCISLWARFSFISFNYNVPPLLQELDSLLKNSMIDNLLFTGLTTDVCGMDLFNVDRNELLTCLSAYYVAWCQRSVLSFELLFCWFLVLSDMGYECLLVEDGCAGSTPENQKVDFE